MNWVEIRREYEHTDVTLKALAEKYGVSEGTMRSRKNREKWQRNAATQRANAATMQRNGPVASDTDGLTDKQRIFVQEYLRDFNATRAAMAAGYKKSIAHTEGWRMLRKQEVQSEIKRQTEIRIEELGLDVRRVIAELMKIAFADISDVSDFGQREVPVFDPEGSLIVNSDTGEPFTQTVNFVALKNADEIDTSVISEVKQGKGGVISVKLHDKLKALEKLERYLDFMTEEEKLRMDKLRADIKAVEEKSW